MQLNEIPDELLIEILSYLDLKSIKAFATASKRGRELLLTYPKLWIMALARADNATYHHLLTQIKPNIPVYDENNSVVLKPLLILAKQHQDLLAHKPQTLALMSHLQLPEMEMRSLPGRPSALMTLPNGSLAVGNFEGSIYILNPVNNQVAQVLQGHSAGILKLLFNSYDQRLISCGNDGVINVWNDDGTCARHIRTESGLMDIVVISATRLACVSDFFKLSIWDTSTGQRVSMIETTPPLWEVQMAFTSLVKIDDHHVALGYETGVISLYNIETGELKCDLDAQGHKKKINGYNRLIPMPNNQLISIFNGAIKVWNLNTQQCEHECNIAFFFEPENITSCILVSTDRLATSSRNGEIKIWNIFNGRCLQTIKINGNNSAPKHALMLSAEKNALYLIVNNKIRKIDFASVNLDNDIQLERFSLSYRPG